MLEYIFFTTHARFSRFSCLCGEIKTSAFRLVNKKRSNKQKHSFLRKKRQTTFSRCNGSKNTFLARFNEESRNGAMRRKKYGVYLVLRTTRGMKKCIPSPRYTIYYLLIHAGLAGFFVPLSDRRAQNCSLHVTKMNCYLNAKSIDM